jgi:uncharacterized membrane protein YkvA (DUF1232 family)
LNSGVQAMAWNGMPAWARRIRREAHAVYLAARDPRTPRYVKALGILTAAYALSPIDLIPDFIPVLGYVDDAIILPLLLLATIKLVPADVMAESRAAAALAAQRPISKIAAAAIVSVWIVSVALAAWLVYRHLGA